MCAAVGVVAAMAGAQVAQATVTPGTLFGDSYIVQNGEGPNARFYAVMDVYIKCSSSADIISSTFGVAAYPSSYTLNNGICFAHSAEQASASSWLPCNNDGSAWDSYLTCGNRVQGTDPGEACAAICLRLDTNWGNSSSGCQIDGQSGGAGWYPCIGASTTTNPYARAGQYSGHGSVNTAKCTTTIAGNGITPGQSLTNYWMVGRFSIDITAGSIVGVPMLTLQFCIAGKNNGTTTFTGATQAAGRFNYTLSYGTPGMRGCPSDLDKNGLVDTADISLLLLDFGPCTGCPADLDGNGLVDSADISLLLMDVGTCPG